MQMIKPMLDEVQAKYKNNREKLGEEMQKIYQREGYNPASGCLPLLIQMPILFGLIEVIYHPLKYIMRLPESVIAQGEQIALSLLNSERVLSHAQLLVINDIKNGVEAYSVLGADVVRQIGDFSLSFLGMNLGDVPTVSMFTDIFKGQFNPVIIIPLISGVSALLMSIFSMRHTPMTDSGGANASMKGMMYTMPIFSTMIAFQVPAGVGLYWFYSNIVAIAQSFILNKFYNPKELAEKARAEMEERRERERQERIEAKKRAKENGEDARALSQKEQNKRKIAEARRRAAEKYGDLYEEDNGDDI
jgi:YidC/Oxa1 family membrane protein insertase